MTHSYLRVAVIFIVVITPSLASAMGLRSFVALPVEKGGKVVRLQLLNNRDTNTDTFVANLAWGISHKQTLLMGLPYRLSPGGSEQIGDVSLLYRHITWQNDQHDGSERFALFGGAILPTDDKRDAAWQAGGVYTKYVGRHEWDIDALYQAGTGNRQDTGRYDVSWQYRLSPDVYPDWGSPDAEWDSVIELNGRWHEDNGITHQVTLGLQRITQQWVLEAGFVKDVNKQHNTQVLVSIRFHY
ncbi:MAG: hypothetical protein COB62_02340 [Piscirickettsiaceae bacterium]|nr:MAG: hypothetical protein COB62_02340 [Piscirickettsiaceae bacterium]